MNNMSGMNMGQGFDIKGTWENKLTGERIVAKGTVFEDNQMIIMTMDGRRVNYDKFKDYIQISEKNLEARPPQNKKTNNPLTSVINTNAHTNNTLIDNTLLDNIYSNPDDNLFESSAQNSTVSTGVPLWGDQIPRDNGLYTGMNNYGTGILPNTITNQPNQIVLKSLENLSDEDKPQIDINIIWDNKEVINFLYKYMNITPEEITDAIIYKYFNDDEIRKSLSLKISELMGIDDEGGEEIKPTSKPRGRRPKQKDE